MNSKIVFLQTMYVEANASYCHEDIIGNCWRYKKVYERVMHFK